MQVCVRDESASGQSLYEISLEFLSERITVRELLRERVHHEVREFNRQQDKLIFQGLVEPTDAERTLNGSKLQRTGRSTGKHSLRWRWKALRVTPSSCSSIIARPKNSMKSSWWDQRRR